MVKKCGYCGKAFDAVYSQTKYCCSDCKRLAHRRQERELYNERTYLYNPGAIPWRCRSHGQTNCLKCSLERCVYD